MQGTSKRSILKKTAQVGFSALVSKFLGIIREVFQVGYLGIGVASDAFSLAFKIPNMLRRVFAEGALSAATIPTLVKIVKEDEKATASKLISLIMIVMGITVFALCVTVIALDEKVILLFAPGFIYKPEELSLATSLIRILIFFILFISPSALLAGAMQAKNHFTVPAWGPAILNIVYIIGLIVCNFLHWPVQYFCYFLLLGGLIQLIMHIIMYRRLGFEFMMPDSSSLKYFFQVMYKFIPCVFSISIVEINLMIDAWFASSLPVGSMTLINLASRFMGIALSVFAAAFSSILLSHFSRVSTYAPKRLSFYLYESAKLIFFITIPATLFMCFFSYNLFYTVFYKLTKMTLEETSQASILLIAFLGGLFFYSVNKLILSLYYSLHSTFLPTVVTVVGTLSNYFLNKLLIVQFGVTGLAIATSISAVIQTILFLIILHYAFNFTLYLSRFLNFMIKFIAQLFLISVLFLLVYKLCVNSILLLNPKYANFFLNSLGLWLWVGPLCLIMALLIYILRKPFGIKLYFLD